MTELPPENVPSNLIEPEETLPPVSLADLPTPLQEAVDRAGWKELMPVQARALPYLLAERDLMIQSRTGTGKTGAFLLAILERLDRSLDATQALILVPTRELARQVTEEAETLLRGTGLRVVAVYGGVAYGPQNDALRRGAHLVVGTPGRVLDHLIRRTFSLDDLRILVLDEADRMLSMGFYPDMRDVQSFLPGREINAYLFSATFPEHVLRLAKEFLTRPELLSLSGGQIHVTEIEHVYYRVPDMDKDRSLVRIMEIENPPSALIFCNTRMRVNYVSVVLRRFGFDVEELSSDLSQAAREKVMARVREGRLRYVVATDVAARGIDLPALSHVILYETPDDVEGYIHRAGRTGRAGATGVAISLIDALEEARLKAIARHYGIEMTDRPLPSDSDVEGVIAQRMVARLEARLRRHDAVVSERRQWFGPLAQRLGQSDDGLAMMAMLLDDIYQQDFHGQPPPVPGGESRRPPPERRPKDRPTGGRPRPRRRRT